MRNVNFHHWLVLVVFSSTLLAPRVLGELTHRYTFTADANDSVGTAHGTLMGGAVVSADAVLLDGVAGTYVALPPALLEGYTSVTIETWAITDVNANWNRLFDFGDFNANNEGRNYLFVSTHSVVSRGHQLLLAGPVALRERSLLRGWDRRFPHSQYGAELGRHRGGISGRTRPGSV